MIGGAAFVAFAIGRSAVPRAQAPGVNVFTQHNDNARTGSNLRETALTVQSVSSGQFGLLFSLGPLDGEVYAQPLYVSGLSVGGHSYNVVYIATEHNSLYAFDADGGVTAPLWQRNFGAAVIQDPVNDPADTLIPDCADLTPEVGITSTPVIDPASSTIFVVAKTRDDDGTIHQRLHALNLADGSERGVVDIQATVTTDNGPLSFDPALHLNRPGLLESGGRIYLAFGSLCDYGAYQGWVLGYDASTLALASAYVVTPNGEEGSVWQAGQGITADAAGNLYLITSNGTFSTTDLSDSFVKLTPGAGGLTIADFFTPKNQDFLATNDYDLGAGGALLLPGTSFLLGGGKEGRLYLVDGNNMGQFDPNADHVVQTFQASDVAFVNEIRSSPVYWASPAGPRIYLWAGKDPLKEFSFDGASIATAPVARSTMISTANPGGVLSVSANGGVAGSGVVWALLTSDSSPSAQPVPGVLRAFDAENVANELWNSDNNPADNLGNFSKFTAPTIANGKVYAATFSNAVRVYGLRSAAPPGAPANPSPPDGATNVDTSVTLTWSPVGATSYDVSFGTTSPPPLVASGLTNTSVAQSGLAPGTRYFWQIVARNGAGATTGPVWSFTTSAGGGGGALPAPWTNQDVGATGVSGSASYANGTFTVRGAGADIWGTSDAFQFVSQSLSGDGQIVARVTGLTNTNSFAKAGVMIRESLADDAAHVILDLRPTGDIEFMTRPSTGAATSWAAGAVQSPPAWLKVTRAGSTITGSVSADGVTWSAVGSTTLTIGASANVGLVVSSHDTSALATATFDNVAVTTSGGGGGGTVPSPWATADVGATGVTGSASDASGTFTVRGAGADIWGTSDGFRYVYQPLAGDGTIVARITGLNASNAFAKAGLMIRESLAATAAHVMLDLRPTSDIEFMTRPASGAATTWLAGAVQGTPAWLKLTRSGSTVTGAVSADGASWQTVGSTTLSIGSAALVGLLVSSHDTTTLATGTFDTVTVTSGGGGGTPPGVPSSPSPANGATGVATTPTLTWVASGATSYDVHFGPANPPPTVTTGQPSASYTPAALAPSTPYFWQVVAHNSAGTSPGPVWSFTTAGGGGGGGLPSPWVNQDVGATGTAGSASDASGTFTVRGAGADIWGASDAFQYVYQSLSGDGQIVARVTGLTNTNTFAKAGVMIRESLADNAAHVILDVRPTTDVEFMTRPSTGADTTWLAGTTQALPAWLKLVRSGSTITGAVSANGTTWQTVGSTTLAIGSTALVGVLALSHDPSTLTTATFDNVSVTGGAPPPPPPPPPPSGDVVLYASDLPASARHGSWTTASDGRSPNGVKLVTSNTGVANTATALASPTDYVDVSFTAAAGTPYTLWLRLQALNNDKFNDSVWVQFSDAQAGGSAIYPLNTTSGLLVNLATDGTAASLNGWGWQNTAYWLAQPTTVTFATSGAHTLRIQVREDGVQLDQIVLSASTYLNAPPGPPGGDSTIVPKPQP